MQRVTTFFNTPASNFTTSCPPLLCTKLRMTGTNLLIICGIELELTEAAGQGSQVGQATRLAAAQSARQATQQFAGAARFGRRFDQVLKAGHGRGHLAEITAQLALGHLEQQARPTLGLTLLDPQLRHQLRNQFIHKLNSCMLRYLPTNECSKLPSHEWPSQFSCPARTP
jgi:hypothetical protein